MGEGKSCLIEELKKLKESSKEAVENLDSFTEFKEYLHVHRQVQKELLTILESAAQSSFSQLILVCGGVGDGKSHLISYLIQKYPILMGQFEKHNDATESFEPDKTSIDTLNDVLDAFSDNRLEMKEPVKLILAINLGTLNNFIESSKYQSRFTKLRKYVLDKKILETIIIDNQYENNQSFQFINFSDYHMFTIDGGGPKSSYIYELITKITNSENDNPFYTSYQNNCISCVCNKKCPIKANYQFFMDENVKEKIVQLFIELIIKQKIIISTRALLNFIFDTIVCNYISNFQISTFKYEISSLSFGDYVKYLTPNILFEQVEASNILDALRYLDPIRDRKEEIDRLIIELNTMENISCIFKEHIDNIYTDYFQEIAENKDQLNSELAKNKNLKKVLTKTFLRMYLFKDKSNLLDLTDVVYIEYMQNLYWWNKGEKNKLKPLFDNVKESIYKWNGESAPESINLFIGRNQLDYKVSQRLALSPDLSDLAQICENEIHKFIPYLVLKYKLSNKDLTYSIAIDFSLYKLLMKIRKGYRPNKRDKNSYINFVEFVNKILKLGTHNKELILQERSGNRKSFKLAYDADFEQYSFKET